MNANDKPMYSSLKSNLVKQMIFIFILINFLPQHRWEVTYRSIDMPKITVTLWLAEKSQKLLHWLQLFTSLLLLYIFLSPPQISQLLTWNLTKGLFMVKHSTTNTIYLLSIVPFWSSYPAYTMEKFRWQLIMNKSKSSRQHQLVLVISVSGIPFLKS